MPLAAVVAACGFLLVPVLSGGSGGSDAGSADPTPVAEPASDDPLASAAPTRLARRELEAPLLELYLEASGETGLDWTVVAAADQLERAGRGLSDADRVLAIAYNLDGFGAPEDYRTALIARGGPTFARNVLRLAERYRGLVGRDRIPVSSGPLAPPTRGEAVAGFGRRGGVFHDGIDIFAPTGTVIRAPAAGLVTRAGTHGLFGEYTCVVHRFDPPLLTRPDATTCYGSQSRSLVEAGDEVRRGQKIGLVGCTGHCVSPHLHFQLRDGVGDAALAADPAPFLGDLGREIGSGAPLERPPEPSPAAP